MGLMDKMKETAAKGAEMAKTGAKAAQDKVEEQKINKKIADLKEELGGVVYAQKTGAEKPTADASFEAAVDRLVAEITQQQEALAGVGAEDATDPTATAGSGDAAEAADAT